MTTVTDTEYGVFTTAETLAFSISGLPGSRNYTVVDRAGTEVASGTQATDGTLTLSGFTLLGYFVLTIDSITHPFARIPASITPDNRFGMNTHFDQGWPTSLVEILVKVGCNSVRDQVHWDHIELSAGVYTWTYESSRYDTFFSALSAASINVMLPANAFGNSLYDSGETPWSSTALTAFQNFTAAVLARWSNWDGVETSNELDGAFCFGSHCSDRTAMFDGLRTATKAARDASRPALPLVGPSSAWGNLSWWKTLGDAGKLNDLYALSYHYFGGRAQQLCDAFALSFSGRTKLWLTEQWNIPVGLLDSPWLTTQFLEALSSSVERVWWYVFMDNVGVEGLMRSASVPGAMLPEFAQMVRRMGGSALTRPTCGLNTRIIKSGSNFCCWTYLDTVHLLPNGTSITIEDIYGNSTSYTSGSIVVGQEPVYIIGADSVTDLDAANCIAQSPIQYSLTQGSGNDDWYYGSAEKVDDIRTRVFETMDVVSGDAYWRLTRDGYSTQSFDAGQVGYEWTVLRYKPNFSGPVEAVLEVRRSFPSSGPILFAYIFADDGAGTILAQHGLMLRQPDVIQEFRHLRAKFNCVTGQPIDFILDMDSAGGGYQQVSWRASILHDEGTTGLISVEVVEESTTARTLTIADRGRYIRCSNASATVITVNSGVFAANDVVHIAQKGTGAVSMAGTATKSGSFAFGQHKVAALVFTGTGAYDIIPGA